MIERLVVYEQNDVFFDFAEQILEVVFDRAQSRTVSYVQKNEDGTLTMLAVAVFNNWFKHSVELSLATTKGLWATKRFIRAMYEYAFNYGNIIRIHMVSEVSNDEANQGHLRLGHKYEGKLEDWFGEGKDGLIYGLTKRNYLKGKWAIKRKINE